MRIIKNIFKIKGESSLKKEDRFKSSRKIDTSGSVEKNIKLDYVYKFLSSIDIGSAIWMLYLGYKGMSLIEIGILEAIHHGTSLLCEIPTGALADLMGRKKSIVLGRLMSAMGAILMLTANSFIGFAIAFVISPLSYNLNSGSEEALVYDSLKIIGKEEEYLKINGKLNFIIEVAQGIAVLVGGILSDYSFGYSYVLAVIISLCAFGVSLGFKEPDIHEEKKERITIRNHFKECHKVMKENKNLILMMMFFEGIFTVGSTTHFYSQQYFSNMGYSRSFIAIIYVLASIGCALAATQAYKVERKMKSHILYIVPILGGIFLLIIGGRTGIISILGFIMFSVSINILYPISSNYINKLIPSAQRATLISVQSMFFSIFMIVVFPIVGVIGQFISLEVTFIILAGISIILGVLTKKRVTTKLSINKAEKNVS